MSRSSLLKADRQRHRRSIIRRLGDMWKLGSYSFSFLLFIKLVFSYLDPGSGSLIIQILVAGLLSLTFFVGMFWRKIKGLLGFSKKSAEDELTEASQVEDKPEDQE